MLFKFIFTQKINIVDPLKTYNTKSKKKIVFPFNKTETQS
jgi:hypothetical protein